MCIFHEWQEGVVQIRRLHHFMEHAGNFRATLTASNKLQPSKKHKMRDAIFANDCAI